MAGRTHSEKPTELLSKLEFRERYSIPNGLIVHLMNGGPVPTEKEPFNATVFSKEQFNVELRFPFPSLFK